MGVAVGRRIDDDLQAFGCVLVAVVEAVLSADIGCGLGGKLAAPERIEFGAVVVRKEHVVVREREAIGFDIAKERHRRERTCHRRIWDAGADAK